MFRRLRIAVSVFCTILCAILITIWNLEAGTAAYGHFPGVSRFVITSYCFGETLWDDTVAAHVEFGLQAANDSQWRVARFRGVGGELPEGFGFTVYAGESAITVHAPHWFFALLCAAVAAIPWTPSVTWTRRFSLRTMLIATTLIALTFGMVLYLIRQ
jgi:hypothetical protein